MSATRPRDAGRVREALASTRMALEELRMALGTWCDSVAQDAEARQGAAAGAADPAKDPEFRLALDALDLGQFVVTPALDSVEAKFTRAEAGITPDIEAEPELGDD